MFYSLLLTGVQYILLIWLLWINPKLVDTPVYLVFQISGILLGFWAIFEMQKSKLNIAPNVRKGAILISSGPYFLVRHPMYLALLLFFLPVLSVNQSIAYLLLLSVFIINLILKLSYEEKLLTEKFEMYSVYKEKTWRLVPYVY